MHKGPIWLQGNQRGKEKQFIDCNKLINFPLVSCNLWAAKQSSNMHKEENICRSRKQVPVKRSVIELRNVQMGSRHSDVLPIGFNSH